MTCPDWRRLDPSRRDRPGAGGTTSWDEALRHLDSGCQRCRQEALAADPTLVFRRLAVPELGPSEEADEVAAARLAVAAMRTASRMQRGLQGRSPGEAVTAALPAALAALRLNRSRQSRPLSSARWALAAGLTAMALLFGSSHGWRGDAGHGAGPERPLPSASVRLAGPGSGLAGRSTSASGPGSHWSRSEGGAEAMPAATRSSIDGLSRPEARVYQIDGPQMSVVMIVDDKLDV